MRAKPLKPLVTFDAYGSSEEVLGKEKSITIKPNK
jgi:hypothetical protein